MSRSRRRVFLPRGRVFEHALVDARAKGEVTPELKAAFGDRAVRNARWFRADRGGDRPHADGHEAVLRVRTTSPDRRDMPRPRAWTSTWRDLLERIPTWGLVLGAVVFGGQAIWSGLRRELGQGDHRRAPGRDLLVRALSKEIGSLDPTSDLLAYSPIAEREWGAWSGRSRRRLAIGTFASSSADRACHRSATSRSTLVFEAE